MLTTATSVVSADDRFAMLGFPDGAGSAQPTGAANYAASVGWADPGLVPGEAQRLPRRHRWRAGVTDRRWASLRSAPTYRSGQPATRNVGWVDPGTCSGRSPTASAATSVASGSDVWRVGLRCAQRQPTGAHGCGARLLGFAALSANLQERTMWCSIVGLRCAQRHHTRALQRPHAFP
jgi:hypothetical protein